MIRTQRSRNVLGMKIRQLIFCCISLCYQQQRLGIDFTKFWHTSSSMEFQASNKPSLSQSLFHILFWIIFSKGAQLHCGLGSECLLQSLSGRYKSSKVDCYSQFHCTLLQNAEVDKFVHFTVYKMQTVYSSTRHASSNH